MKIACVLVTHLRAKMEMRRQPHLKDRAALVIDRSQGRPLVIDHFPAATGVMAGMTLEQALSRQTGGAVLEADEAAYRKTQRQILTSLQGISDLVEGAELGAAYVGLDGLEAMYHGEAQLLNALLNAVPQDLMPRVGIGETKFPAYVAARTGPPLGAAKVPPDVARFLAPHPVGLLPIPAAIREEMQRLGLNTLGDVARMKAAALTDRFGPAGQKAWALAQGIDDAPLIPLKHEESVHEQTALPFTSVSLELLLKAVETLLKRAYSRPQMQGRYAGGITLTCLLYKAHPWEKQIHFRQAVGQWEKASSIVRRQLEADQPQAPVEEVSLELSNITGESGMQLSLLPEVRHDRERRLAEAERQLQARTGGRPALYRVVQIAPWHPAPEMRAMQVPFDASGAGGMKPLSTPAPVSVREGPEGQPAAVSLGREWRRVARIEDLWCFDLWWLPQPLSRTYYRVGWENGGEMTLFQDQRQGCWFQQAP